jgi:hypothetical protein
LAHCEACRFRGRYSGRKPTSGRSAQSDAGRDFAAWFGLVPRQISTGDRTILGRISKRGNRRPGRNRAWDLGFGTRCTFRLATGSCPFMALSCRARRRTPRHLPGVRRTPNVGTAAAANDPKRTLAAPNSRTLRNFGAATSRSFRLDVRRPGPPCPALDKSSAAHLIVGD